MDEIESLIKKEHQIISKYLDRLLDQNPVNYPALVAFCRKFVEDNHHYKEEEFIFKPLQNHKRLQEGGPFCVLYFDCYMNNSPVNKAMDLSRKLQQKLFFKKMGHSVKNNLEASDLVCDVSAKSSSTEKTKNDHSFNFQITDRMKDLYAKNTPLNIPIEEHEVGKFLLSLAEIILIEFGSISVQNLNDNVRVNLKDISERKLQSLSENSLDKISDLKILRDISLNRQSDLAPEVESTLKEIFEFYQTLQMDHFKKEESCFLKMVRNITRIEEQEKMLMDFKKYLPAIQEAPIQEFLNG